MSQAQTAAALGSLSPVSLEELTAAAALTTRVDRKYIVPIAAAPQILAALPRDTSVLEMGGRRQMEYASRYFDTHRLDSYYGAAYGRRRRFKVRARHYVDTGGWFWEVKTKTASKATAKSRVEVTDGHLDDEAVNYTEELLALGGIAEAHALSRLLRPVLTTTYRRATLLLPGDAHTAPSRGTIDVDLGWHPEDGAGFTLHDSVIFETKGETRAGALDRALWRLGHRPVSISKYATGLAAIYAELPANKWRRVLNRHFPTANGAQRTYTRANPRASATRSSPA